MRREKEEGGREFLGELPYRVRGKKPEKYSVPEFRGLLGKVRGRHIEFLRTVATIAPPKRTR